MVAQLILYIIVGLLAALLGALLALRIQYRYWKNILAGHEGWEHAQEAHHRSWEERQEQLIAEAESRISVQVQQLHQDWQHWEVKDAERLATQARQQQLSEEQARLERELARLPRVEETPIGSDGKRQQPPTEANWRPAMLQGTNLASKDLSHRYLGRADMRNANLAHANLFMADLSGACLADADLTDADLSGANLSSADLRNALLEGTNLLVADLNNTILTGADVLGARNLTTQQLYSAIYDSSTQLDGDLDLTMPRMFSVRPSMLSAPSMPSASSTPPKTALPMPATPPIVELTATDTQSISPADNPVEVHSAPVDFTPELSEPVISDDADTFTVEQPEQEITETEKSNAEQETLPETPLPVMLAEMPGLPEPMEREDREDAESQTVPQPVSSSNGNENKSKQHPANPRLNSQNGKNNARIKYSGRKRAKAG